VSLLKTCAASPLPTSDTRRLSDIGEMPRYRAISDHVLDRQFLSERERQVAGNERAALLDFDARDILRPQIHDEAPFVLGFE
jgi:hypothetical protein